MGRSLHLKDHWQEQRLFLTRLIAAGVVVLLLAGVLVSRLVFLQVLEYESFSAQSQGNRLRPEPLASSRGLILDRNGNVVAENVPNWQLVAVPEDLDDVEATLTALEALGLVDPGEHADLVEDIDSSVAFKRVRLASLTEEQAATFAVRRHLFAGVEIQEALVRHYPFGEVTAHALGYVSRIDQPDLARIERSEYLATSTIGKTGVERSYEASLHGQEGHRQQVVNARGRIIDENAVGAGVEPEWPVPGQNLILGIDMRLQLAAFEALAGMRGAVVAIDTTRGDVLALVSTPAFDPNLFSTRISSADYNALNTDPDQPLFNRAVVGTYPPGSTVKPFLALVALQQEHMHPETEIYCPGHFQLPNSSLRFGDWKEGGHGRMNMHGAIVQSCDVYFYQLALALEVDNMARGMAVFGFGAPTGLDVIGERRGALPSREYKRERFSRREDQVWYRGDTVNAGIGQGLWEVTPLQLAHATAMLAARGRRFVPRLVIGTEDGVTREKVWLDPKEIEGVVGVDPLHWQEIHDAMVGVTTEPSGSARTPLQGTTYVVAGKTGTAQKFTYARDTEYNEDEIDERMRDHGLFVAYAPADKPTIALAVVVENGGGGSRAAAPVARKILDAYFPEPTLVASDH